MKNSVLKVRHLIISLGVFKIEKREPMAGELEDPDLCSDNEHADKCKMLEIESGPVLKVLERRNYEVKRHLFPYKNWKTFETKG